MAIKIGTGDLAKYPFLNEAGEYLRTSSFDWAELGRPELKPIIDRAISRIEYELAGQVYDSLERYETEILTFLVSLILVKSVGIEPIFKKFALAEARRAEKFLTEDLKRSTDEQKRGVISKIFSDLFNLKIAISPDGRIFEVPVTDYLARASHFHEQEWKLINRLVYGGRVFLDADETVRLVRNEISKMIYERVKAMNLPTLPENISSVSSELRSKLSSRYEYKVHAVTDYAPCIKHAMEVMNKGENLPHSARLMLATYMLAIGKGVDEIVMLFENAPDFNEKITRYQVEHLAGIKGGQTKYSVPSCDKLRSENLCYATQGCNGIINPVQFGRRKKSVQQAGGNPSG